MDRERGDTADLPIKGNDTVALAISLVIAALTAVASLAGLLYRASVYPTDELAQSFVPNKKDVLCTVAFWSTTSIRASRSLNGSFSSSAVRVACSMAALPL